MYLFWILGLLILIVVFWDAFLTIFSLRGGGPVTNRIASGGWRMLLSLHVKKDIHTLLSLTGPLILICIVLFWYFATSLAWFLIFIGQQESVVVNTSQADTTIMQKLYFIGTTISDLGYGDLVPSAFPWTVLSPLAALSATLVISAALSYILPVVAAGLEKRVIAKRIHELGESPQEMVNNLWHHGGQSLSGYVVDTITQIQSFTYKHLSYPILLYFHSAKSSQSLALAMLNLADALFLISKGTPSADQPLGGFTPIALRTIDEFSHLADQKNAIEMQDNLDVPPHLSPSTLKHANIETMEEAQFQQALHEYLPQRARLVNLCINDGWCVEKGTTE